MNETPIKRYLPASDFDQTLSFKDSGLVLEKDRTDRVTISEILPRGAQAQAAVV